MNKLKSYKGDIILVLAALVYGSGLVAQKDGMNNLGPFTFTAIRFIMGGIVLIPVAMIVRKHKSPEQKAAEMPVKKMLKGCIATGFVLTAMVVAQQYGLPYTTVGKAGFISGLYVILTPIAGVLFLKRKISPRIWVAAIISVVGFYFLSLSGGIDNINRGDVLMLITAIAGTIYLYTIEYFAGKADTCIFTSLQFLATGAICLPFALILETCTLHDIYLAMWPLLYAGLGICGVGYTFQMLGQKYVESERATILLSLETLFSLLSGMILLNEVLTFREYIGCGLMFAAVMLAETNSKTKKIDEEIYKL
ncbi:MAG: DMT family transporter [Clostridiales bacterium]|nr:DMT family transporter [Clostridiales bacterium]